MSCGNQPAYISVIIVAAFPSVDGTAAQSKVKSQSASRRKNKVKGITITLNLTCHSISAGGRLRTETTHEYSYRGCYAYVSILGSNTKIVHVLFRRVHIA